MAAFTLGSLKFEMADRPESIHDLARSYGAGTATPEDVTERCLARIAAVDPVLNVFVCVDADGARQAARRSRERWRAGRPLSRLDGVPISIKDMFDVAGLPSRRGSLTTSDALVAKSTPVVERLVNAGAVVLGLTATAEFGGAPVTISPLTGITRNAWNRERTAGGSSGGAAVSVAAGLCAAALASDTGGSIRIPASFNGVVGLKPTGGRIPTDPASILRTLGCPGPIARSVAECATMPAVMADPDFGAADPSCPAWSPTEEGDPRGLWVVASRRLGYATMLDPEVEAAFTRVTDVLRALGCDVREVEPRIEDPVGLFQVFTRANYASILGGLDGAQVGQLSAGVRDTRAAGQKLSAAELLAAMRARQRFAEELSAALGPHDLLITPTVAVPPFAADQFMPADPATRTNPRAWSPFGYPINLTEQPAITLPCALTRSGLPIGCQLVAGKWREAQLLNVAAHVERALAFDPTPPAAAIPGDLVHG